MVYYVIYIKKYKSLIEYSLGSKCPLYNIAGTLSIPILEILI